MGLPHFSLTVTGNPVEAALLMGSMIGSSALISPYIKILVKKLRAQLWVVVTTQ